MPRICKVIVAEAHDGVRSVVGEALIGAGYDVQLVSNGCEMREALAAARCDVVVVDVTMQGDDGFELAEEAAKCGASVILTTGDHGQFKEVEASGHRYMLKPFMLPELLQLLEQISRELRCSRRKAARDRH
jgi:two-component system, OmpR family, response regulator